MSPLSKVLDYSEHCLFLIYISSGRIFRILKNGNFLIFFLTAAFDIFTHQTRTEELSGSVTNVNEKKTSAMSYRTEHWKHWDPKRVRERQLQ